MKIVAMLMIFVGAAVAGAADTIEDAFRLVVQCQSPEGTFKLAGYPAYGTSSFEFVKGEQVLNDSLEYCKTRTPCKFEYLVRKGSSGSLRLQAHQVTKTFVDGHYVCHPSRSPIPCYARSWVPEHYEWQVGRGVELWLAPVENGTYKTELFFFQHYPVEGNLALGRDAICRLTGNF